MHELRQQKNSTTVCKNKLRFTIGFILLILSPCTNTLGTVQTDDFAGNYCEAGDRRRFAC